MEKFDCAIAKCPDYSEQSVENALAEALENIGGLDFVKSGMKIVIKPNLVSFKTPDEAATTHPALLKALVKKLVELGASVTVGDSPGGPHSLTVLNRVYAATGMSELEKYGAVLNRNLEQRTVKIENGKVLNELTYTAYLDEADAIIDFCKLKSHAFMGMSAAVKNLYGVIPGLLKPEMHYRFPNEADFAEMLIDINEFFKPVLSIMDAVVGMEGNGPLNGEARPIGAVVASKSSYYCDLVGAELIALDPFGVPTIKAAYDRGLAPKSAAELNIHGSIGELRVADFAAPPVRGLKFMRKGNLLHFIASHALAQTPKLKPSICVGCGECARMCPAKAINMKNKKPIIDRKSCIRCFCCQEFCPKAAMVVHRPLAARVLNKLKL